MLVLSPSAAPSSFDLQLLSLGVYYNILHQTNQFVFGCDLSLALFTNATSSSQSLKSAVHLVENFLEGTLGSVLTPKLAVVHMIEHGFKLLLVHVNIGIEHGEAIDLLNLLLHGPHRLAHVVLLLTSLVNALGQTVHTDVDIHLVAIGIGTGWVAEQAARHRSVDVGTQPQGVDAIVLLVAHVQNLGHPIGRDEEVLSDVSALGELSSVFCLAELQEADLGRHKPSQQVAEDGVVADGDHHFHLPEQRAGVTVVVVAKGDVLHDGLSLLHLRQHIPNMNVEPGLVPAGQDVALRPGSIGSVAKVGRHDHRLGLGIDQTLDKGWDGRTLILLCAATGTGNRHHATILLLLFFINHTLRRHIVTSRAGGRTDQSGIATRPSEAVDGIGLVVEGLVLHPHVLLAGDDADGNAQDECQGAVAPGDAMEQVGVLVVGRGADDAAVGEAKLELEASLVEQSADVAGTFDAGAADKAADGQVVHLGNDGEGVAQRQEGVGDLSHGHERLDDDDAAVGVDAEDVDEGVHVDAAPLGLVRAVRQADGLPARPGRAEGLALRAGLLHLLDDGGDALGVLLRCRAGVANVLGAEGQGGVPKARHGQPEDGHDEGAVVREDVVRQVLHHGAALCSLLLLLGDHLLLFVIGRRIAVIATDVPNQQAEDDRPTDAARGSNGHRRAVGVGGLVLQLGRHRLEGRELHRYCVPRMRGLAEEADADDVAQKAATKDRPSCNRDRNFHNFERAKAPVVDSYPRGLCWYLGSDSDQLSIEKLISLLLGWTLFPVRRIFCILKATRSLDRPKNKKKHKTCHTYLRQRSLVNPMTKA